MKTLKESKAKAYRLKNGLHMRQFGLDHGIYDHSRKQIYMLNPTAGLIFNYLSTGKSEDEIAQNILIACGKSTDNLDAVKKDLTRTIAEFKKLELLEAQESGESMLSEPLIITEKEMTSLNIPYLPPQIKAYSIEELIKKYKKPGNPSFLDTWSAPNRKAPAFLDTYTPERFNVKFLDTWTPDVKRKG